MCLSEMSNCNIIALSSSLAISIGKSLDVDEVELYNWIKSKSKGIGPSRFIKMHLFELMSNDKEN